MFTITLSTETSMISKLPQVVSVTEKKIVKAPIRSQILASATAYKRLIGSVSRSYDMDP